MEELTIYWITPRLGLTDGLNGIKAGQTGKYVIINVAPELANEKANVTINIENEIGIPESALDFVADLINTWIHEKPGQMIVHCLGGVDRSPLVIAWYLHKYRNMSLDMAYEKIKTEKPDIRENAKEWIIYETKNNKLSN